MNAPSSLTGTVCRFGIKITGASPIAVTRTNHFGLITPFGRHILPFIYVTVDSSSTPVILHYPHNSLNSMSCNYLHLSPTVIPLHRSAQDDSPPGHGFWNTN